MATPILATKLYIPPPRSKVVLRPRLMEQLNEGLRQSRGSGSELTLISAPALSMQGQQDTAGFIQSFAGSHHFVLDYLVEEVLQRQPETIQTFLLHTSILDRLCGPLCDAVLREDTDLHPTPPASEQETAGPLTGA